MMVLKDKDILDRLYRVCEASKKFFEDRADNERMAGQVAVSANHYGRSDAYMDVMNMLIEPNRYLADVHPLEEAK